MPWRKCLWSLVFHLGFASHSSAAVIHIPERNFLSTQAGGVPVDDHTDVLRRLDFDLNNDGRVDISFTADRRGLLRSSGPATTQFVGGASPDVLPKGFEIGILPDASSFRWVSMGKPSGVMAGAFLGNELSFFGSWENQTGFIGIRFEADDGDHFGYLHVNVRGASLFHIEQAWESEPNQPILAGTIPEPSAALLIMVSSLGFLIRLR